MKTRRIRIAVAMWPDGSWNCCGCGKLDENMSDKNMVELATEIGDIGDSIFFVEADIPMPEYYVIEGEVVH